MLRQAVIAQKIRSKRTELSALDETLAEIRKRSDEIRERLDAAETEAEIAGIEEEVAAVEREEAEATARQTTLNQEVSDLTEELDAIDQGTGGEHTDDNPKDLKKGDVRMIKRGFFRGLTHADRENIVQREDVQEFLTRTRELAAEKRSVTGGELGIPDVLLGILRDTLESYSKLISRVRKVTVGGKARQTIAGAVPEGVWTEMCGKLNELDILFSQVEVDGYKVGGYIAICNALLEDSDINLADEIMYNIGQAIGLALDKAILYGTGTKMPTGIVARLAQTTKPESWGAKAPTWTDLHTSNLRSIDPADMTPEEFYAKLILALGKAKANYSTGAKFWAMNSTTFANLQARALSFSAAGTIVSGQTGTMPIVGGDVVTLEFIPDGDILGGYGSLYTLAERAGITLANSEHVRFIEDQTVFKGTARYDGMPIFGEGFVGVNIDGGTVTTTMTFAPDKANTAETE